MKKLLLVTTVFYFVLSLNFAQKFQLKNTSSNLDYHNIKFNLEKYELKKMESDKQKFNQIISGAGVHTKKKGYAKLPIFSTAVLIPNYKNMEIQIFPGEYEDIQLDNHILPSRGVLYRNQDIKKIKHKIKREAIVDEWYPKQIASLSDPYIVNNVRGSSIRFYPFQYNAKRKILRVYKTIEIKLVSNNSRPINPLIKNNINTSYELNSIYKSMFLNYSRDANALPMGQYGDLLVISTPRDKEAIQPYIQWKREKGFKVELEIVDPGTNPKELIKKKFASNGNLFYVTLVGDYDDIKSDIGTEQSAPMDPMLGCVAGTDNFPDICIGRFSANNSEEVVTQVSKTIKYEKSPDVNGDWYSKVMHISSDEGDGSGDDNESDTQHMNVLWKEKLSKFTYINNDTLYDPGVTAQNVADKVNGKMGLINYIGHGDVTEWVTSKFNNSNVDELTNNDYLPWIISVACVNGKFHDGDCFAEKWLRKKDGGAVMFLGSTINQPWSPPMMGQDYMMDLLIGGYDYEKHTGQSGISSNEQRTLVGSLVFNSLVLMLKEAPTDNDVLETIQTWSIFGDPSLQVRTKKPEQIKISNKEIKSGKPFTTIISSDKPQKGIVVSLAQGKNVFTGITDETGKVSINHTIIPGEFSIVASGFNTTTISEKGSLISPEAYPVVNEYIVKDNDGLVNGKAELNEKLSLYFSVKNFGQKKIETSKAILSFADKRISVTKNSLEISPIDPTTQVELKGFEFKILQHIPDGEKIKGLIEIKSGSKTFAYEIKITACSPNLKYVSSKIDDSKTPKEKNEILDAGETAEVNITIKNIGQSSGIKSEFELKSLSPYLTVTNSPNSIDSLKENQSKNIPFKVTAKENTPLETEAKLLLTKKVNGFSESDTIKVMIGMFPTYTMGTKKDTVKFGRFFDSGGKTEAYQLNEDLIHTFYPKEKGKSIQLKFVKFDIEQDYDFLTIYDGPDTNSTLMGQKNYTGNEIQEIFTATNNLGALTIRFISDDYEVMSGWEALINTDVMTDIEVAKNDLPETFSLQQNYPNPFNPSTTISFNLPEDSKVVLDVYNIMGQRVIRLVHNEDKTAGSYSVVWNGTNESGQTVASGIYIYRIKAKNFVQSKKMILIK